MITIKQLDPNYPRLGYEIKKGLVIDLPRGDGKADIIEDQGSLYLSEGSCVVRVVPDTIQLADDASVTVKMHRHEDDNHLILSDLTVALSVGNVTHSIWSLVAVLLQMT